MVRFVRISSLLCADIFVGYAFFVMQDYLTDVWKLNFTHAAAILNFWNGLTMVLPVFFLFLVHTFLRHRGMLMISSIAYTVGIALVAMSTPPVLAKTTGTCKQYEPECIGHTQKALYYTGMTLIAVGMAGNLVSVMAFLNEQYPNHGEQNENDMSTLRFWQLLEQYAKDEELKEKDESKVLWQLLGMILVVIFSIVGAIVLPYIKPWSIRFGIPAIFTAFATVLFFTGIRKYETAELNKRSPMTNVFRVLVASYFKRSLRHPDNDRLLYRRDGEDCKRFTRTRCLRCLGKAAIIRDDMKLEDHKNNGWRLCSVAEVEEAKIAVRMVPMWLTFIICGIVSSIGNTYFVEQAKNLNRHWGKWNLPLAALLLFFKWAQSIFDCLASCLLGSQKEDGGTAKKCTSPIRIPSPVGIVVAMVFSILCCITAAKIEEKRLHTVRKHGLLDKPDDKIPMSVYWLLFQFFLLAGLDSFRNKSIAAFYAAEAPPSMKDYLEYLANGVTGLGFMFSVLTVYVVGKVSEKGNKPNWFQDTLNKSRLDRYYWVLAVVSAANLVVFIGVASCYNYRHGTEEGKQMDGEAGGGENAGGEDGGAGDEDGDGGGQPCCC